MKIKISWKAFGDKPEIGRYASTVEIEMPEVVGKFASNKQICEQIFHQTNTYSGPIWDAIKPKMAETRTHTSISIGDEIDIDGQVYICADVEFIKKEDAEIRKIDGTIWSVVQKEGVYFNDVFQIDQDRMMTKMADAEMGDI